MRTRRGLPHANTFPVLRVRRGAKRVLGVCVALHSLSFLLWEDDEASHPIFLLWVRQAASWDPLPPSVSRQSACVTPVARLAQHYLVGRPVLRALARPRAGQLDSALGHSRSGPRVRSVRWGSRPAVWWTPAPLL